MLKEWDGQNGDKANKESSAAVIVLVASAESVTNRDFWSSDTQNVALDTDTDQHRKMY